PGQSIYSITLEQALELFKMPRTLGEHDGETVTVGIGRFGPFAKRGSTYASLTKEDDPYTIGLDRAVQLIEEKEEIEIGRASGRSEEHTSELQSRENLVCRLLL